MTTPAPRGFLPCSPIGSGSSALVYLAISLSDGLPFALKSPVSPSSSSSLQNELRLLLSLSSPFVLRCLGADFSGPDPSVPSHIFLEFMEGGSISSLLKRSGGRLDERRTRFYARSIVQGLEYLHNNGIVHCDIKGQNILIGSSGVKIADFGAAKRTGAGASRRDQFRGTPLWMAPEVVQGVEQEYASDIWSLGCTVVEMLQGRPPWGYMSDMSAALFKLGSSEEDPPLPTAISDDARDFLRHCLQRDPRSRWTASQLLNHPFLCNIPAGDEAKHEKVSPRSTLDFLPIDGSDSEDFSDCGLVLKLAAKREQSLAPSKAPAVKRLFADAFDNLNDHEWMTVKVTGRRARQMPFMKSGGNAHVTRACDVSFDAAKFLRNRKPVG